MTKAAEQVVPGGRCCTNTMAFRVSCMTISYRIIIQASLHDDSAPSRC
jgi:hypothetical protein